MPTWVSCWAGLGIAALIAASSWAPQTAAALDLYVSPTGDDDNPGTSAAPFKTILAASRVAIPGTTVRVIPGIYAGGFTTMANGRASNPIHYVSQPSWAARIVPAEDSPHDMAWENRGAHVVIDGFDVDGSEYRSGKPWRFGIYTAGSHSVIENNRVRHIAWNAPCGGRGGAGIAGDSYYGGTDIDLVANIVHHVGPASCRYIHGIYQTAPGKVVNNLVYRIAGWGIHLWHDANHVTVANNTIFNSAGGGLLVGGGDFVNTAGPADYIVVVNNIVFDNNAGIFEAGRTGSHNVFRNNLSSRNEVDWRLRTSEADPAAITVDPGFVNYAPTGGGDYHLAAGSPAIDAGTPFEAPSSDLDGVSRPQGSGYDIGAYECVAVAPPSSCRSGPP